jgi:N-acetylglucosaminyldiphosphoundecaprenol N-acetyl-beta-D-mannosaminyltransferase
MSTLTGDRLPVGTVRFDPLTRWDAADHARDELTRGRGGRILLLSDDQLRQFDASSDADLVLAGSASAVWASRLAGTPLPERITAAGLTDALCAASNSDRRKVRLVGGQPGAAGIPSAAQRAAAILGVRHHGLLVAGTTAPTSSVATDLAALEVAVGQVVEAKPDLVLIGVDQKANEAALVAAVRASLPRAWVFGALGLIREIVGDPGHRSSRRANVAFPARLLARAAAVRLSLGLNLRAS